MHESTATMGNAVSTSNDDETSTEANHAVGNCKVLNGGDTDDVSTLKEGGNDDVSTLKEGGNDDVSAEKEGNSDVSAVTENDLHQTKTAMML